MDVFDLVRVDGRRRRAVRSGAFSWSLRTISRRMRPAVCNFEQRTRPGSDRMSRMPYYSFVAFGDNVRSEDLGTMDLRDDADARSFGDGVIRDVMRTDAAFYAGWTLDIAQEERVVASTPFAGPGSNFPQGP